MNIIEIIKKRKSWRTFKDEMPDSSDLESLETFIKNNKKTLFGSNVKFTFIDMDKIDRGRRRVLGTYGVIKGARIFLAGWVNKNANMLVDFGYAMEKNILEATRLGFATCWLGATYNREGYIKKLGIDTEKEELIAITPVGYNKEKRCVKDLAMRKFVDSDMRKEQGEMFFSKNYGTALTKEEAGEYCTCLEMVRLAPSASNRQPWIVIADHKSKNTENITYHFFLKRNPEYKYRHIQPIDIGIAAAHFELTAEELGLKGNWEKLDGINVPDACEYVVSWIATSN